MDFSFALQIMKHGGKVRRSLWYSGYAMIEYGLIYRHHKGEEKELCVLYQPDILANDWEEVELTAQINELQ